MTHRPEFSRCLIAEAGPRVRPPRKAALPAPSVRSELLERPLGDAFASMRDAAAGIVALLCDTSSPSRLPILGAADPVRHLTWLVPLGAAAPLVLVIAGVHWAWALAMVAMVVALGLRLVFGLSRRVAVLAREIAADIEHGVDPLDLVDEISTLVQLDPDHDVARAVLARIRLREGDALAALLQLAPLRDRHPDDGEIVLTAAAAYATLGSATDALRMLDALRLDDAHPWTPRVRQFRDVCAEENELSVRASSGDLERDS